MVKPLAQLNFSNAFNTVDFDTLFGVLPSFNISPSVTDWFHSYQFGHRQRIYTEITQNESSSWYTTFAGVTQGGVLSPLLFAMLINCISNNRVP